MDADLTLQLINATVQIEQPNADGTRTVGTGFLLDAPAPDGTPRTVLVTAAHVYDKMPMAEVRIGWRYADATGAWKYDPQPLKVREGSRPLWTRHPDRDVAVMAIKAPPEFARAAIPVSWLAETTTFEERRLTPGDEMIAMGFPRGLSSNRAGFPILRFGRVSSYPLWPVAEFPTFLLDFTVFPGNSGGPVIVDRREGPYVAGVLTQEVELNKERLEIGIVTHASFVREALALMDGSGGAKRAGVEGGQGVRALSGGE